MRVTREKAAENRARIVETASRLFREKGFDGVGLDAVMNEVGLTHGGFYGHFTCKEDLAAEAVAHALEKSAELQRQYTNIGDFVSNHLSESHFADRANGCALVALGGDMARRSKGVRSGATSYVRSQLEWLAGLFRGTTAVRRRRAITTLAGVVGALTLARAVEDPTLSEEILSTARQVFGSARRTDDLFWRGTLPDPVAGRPTKATFHSTEERNNR